MPHAQSPVICEACKQRVKHSGTGAAFIVGHKASGTPRMVHARPGCRAKWNRIKAGRMLQWPENRLAAPPTPLKPKEAAPVAPTAPRHQNGTLHTHPQIAPTLTTREFAESELKQLGLRMLEKPRLPDGFPAESYERYKRHRGVANATTITEYRHVLQQGRRKLLQDAGSTARVWGNRPKPAAPAAPQQRAEFIEPPAAPAAPAVTPPPRVQRELTAVEAAQLQRAISACLDVIVSREDYSTLRAIWELARDTV